MVVRDISGLSHVHRQWSCTQVRYVPRYRISGLESLFSKESNYFCFNVLSIVIETYPSMAAPADVPTVSLTITLNHSSTVTHRRP